MARHLALLSLLALLTWRGADATCATASAAVAASVAAGGACVDSAAGNSAATCSATCTAVLDSWVSGCKGAPLPDATPFVVLTLGLPLNATLSACRSAFLARAHTFATQTGATDACSQLTIYMGSAVRDYGVCPKGASLSCTPGCQSALNELAMYCTPTQPINTPAVVLQTFSMQCPTPTCVLADAAASTMAAMFTLGVPNNCTFPFTLPTASAAQRGAVAPRVIAAAAAAAAAAALL